MAKASTFKKFGKAHPNPQQIAKTYDQVNPQHYKTDNGIEVADINEIFHLDWHRGTAVKYILREGKKPGADEVIDMEKAIWYLRRRIGVLKGLYPKRFTESSDGPITSQALSHRKLPSTSHKPNGKKSDKRWKGNRRT